MQKPVLSYRETVSLIARAHVKQQAGLIQLCADKFGWSVERVQTDVNQKLLELSQSSASAA